MSDLKTLALAAKAKIDEPKSRSSWWCYSIEEGEFAKAASPDAILKLLEERDRLREALTDTRKRLQEANESGVINDTLWYSQYETLFDYIDSALEEAR